MIKKILIPAQLTIVFPEYFIIKKHKYILLKN